MQLAVDIGNSRVKSALFKGHELFEQRVSEKEAVYVIKEYFDEFENIEALILSSVREDLDIDMLPIPETIHHIILDHETDLPFKNSYESPKSLGFDRIALAASAIDLFPGKNALLIDAGTCLTMDVITDQAEYLGGVIAPGLQMRLTAMYEGTANLPLLSYDGYSPSQIGKNTEECMLNGAAMGIINEVKQTITSIKEQFEDVSVLITGGDLKVFDIELKSGIFANPNLVLYGLNKILLHNIERP